MLRLPQPRGKNKNGQFKIVSKSQGKNKKGNEKDKIVFSLISDIQMGACIPFKLLNDQYRQIIKCNSGVWDTDYKIWRIPKDNFTVVRAQIPQINPQIVIEDLPQLVSKALKDQQQTLKLVKFNKIITYDPIDRLRVIENNPLYNILYPFQRRTLELSIAKYGRLLIADDMGVGKTLQSLACALQYIDQWPLLIICPSALKLIWMDEITKWLSKIVSPDQVQIINKSGVGIKITQVKIVIISYELATRSIDIFNDFKVVIADQAHYLKNTHAQRTQNLAPFLTSRKRIFLLTGTPAFAKPREIYNMIAIVRPDIYHSLRQFGERYCRLQRNPWTGYLEYQGSRNTAQLYHILKDKAMIRRLKSEVLHQLPQKQRQTIMIQTDRSIVKQIKDLLNKDFIHLDSLRSSEKLVQQGLEGNRGNTSLPRCYQLSGMAKLNGIKQYIKQVMENQVKVLIFAHHKLFLDELETFLTSIKCSLVRIDGDMNHELRQKRVKIFQEQNDVRAAILSITCAGVGYTLTSASVVIFAQLHWTPAMLLQAEDRAHRIGQKSCVNAHYLIGENTLDQILYRALQRKLGTVGQLLNGASLSFGAQKVEKGEIGKISVNNLNDSKQKIQVINMEAESYQKLEKIQPSNVIYQDSQPIDEQERIDILIRKRRAQFEKTKAEQKSKENLKYKPKFN